MDQGAYRQAEERLWRSVDRRPAEHEVQLPQLGVRVRVQEVGEGEPVLYLHGGPNSGSTWAPLVARTTGFRSLLVDRPGTGLSEPLRLGPHDVASFADVFVADILDALGVQRAHVVASSFGGFLALRSAAVMPHRFSRMVQMACPAGAPGMQVPPFMRAIATPGLGRLIGALPPNARAARSILRQIGHGKTLDTGGIPPVFLEWYLALQRHTETMRNETRLISSLISPRGQVHPELALTEELLGRIEVPTHFLWGADDPFGDEEVAEIIASAMGDASLEMLPDAGHLPWLDDSQRAGRTVEHFLRAQPAHTPPLPDDRALEPPPRTIDIKQPSNVDTTADTTTSLDRSLPVIVIHTALRRELRLAGPLVRRVDVGDVKRTATVTEHLRVVLHMLAHHHETEDELAFPPLAERTSGEEPALVELMQEQHAELERRLEQVHAALRTWRTAAGAADRAALADALEGLHLSLVEHLDLEERHVLPMAERLLTEYEWEAIGKHGEKGVQGRDKLLVFGMLVYEGDPAVVAKMLAPAPLLLRVLLPRLSLRAYRRHAAKVHGADHVLNRSQRSRIS